MSLSQIPQSDLSDPCHSQLPSRSPAERKWLRQHLPEILSLEGIVRKHADLLTLRAEASVRYQDRELPVYSISLGCRDEQAPCLFICAGVHGVERIGTQVVLSWLASLLMRESWDKYTKQLFAELRIVCLPILNPAGMSANQRSNANGVDLNRNAPIDAEDKVPFLAGGHRLGSFLPWFRGKRNQPLQTEAQVLQRVFLKEVLPRKQIIALDLHSGFGFRDSLWFPFAYSRKPIDCIAQYLSLNLLWQRNYPQQVYRVEPQAKQYLSHGDLWDFLYQLHKDSPLESEDRVFLPLTLEMGSWNWVKKNPIQLFKPAGLFHPIKTHRRDRVLRRHQLLFDFLASALVNSDQWLPKGREQQSLQELAKQLWFNDLR